MIKEKKKQCTALTGSGADVSILMPWVGEVGGLPTAYKKM